MIQFKKLRYQTCITKALVQHILSEIQFKKLRKTLAKHEILKAFVIAFPCRQFLLRFQLKRSTFESSEESNKMSHRSKSNSKKNEKKRKEGNLCNRKR